MKRVLCVIFVLFISCTWNVGFCSSKYDTQLLKIEEELYGINYSDQPDEKRLARLEQSVYGIVSQKAISERIKKLSEDLSADVLDEKISPTEDTFAEEELAEDNTVRYPVLDRVETKLFHKTYDKTDLKSRIVRIEKHLFNSTYDKEDYNTRVERIKNNVFQNDYQIASESGYEDVPYYSSNDLSGLNKNLYNGFGRSGFSDRLAALENRMLGGDYNSDTDEERLNRLDGAYKAQKSIKKYDSNKFQQGLSTAMQVGAMILMMLCMVL